MFSVDKKKSGEDKYNYGIGLLRIVMCSLVVFQHYFDWFRESHQNVFYSNFGKLMTVHVPVFMILAFYYTDLSSISNGKIKSRLLRLFTPSVFWGLLYFAVYKCVDVLKGTSYISANSDFIYQVLFGTKYNSSMWFQFAIIASTIIVFALYRLMNKQNGMMAIVYMAIISLALQYTGVLYDLLGGMSYHYSQAVFGTIECLPYVAIGVVLCSSSALGKLHQVAAYRIAMIVLPILFIATWMYYPTMFQYPEGGKMYPGIGNCIIAFLLVCMFYGFPLEFVPGFAKWIIKKISSYTMGIYCCHRLVAQVMIELGIERFVPSGSLAFVLVVISVSCIVCIALSAIPLKLVKYSVQ